MNFLGIGVPELLVIMLIALIFVGPQRLPEVAAQMGRLVRQVRRYATDVTGQFREEFDELGREYEAMQVDLQRTQQELHELRDTLQRDAQSASQDIAESVEGVRQEVLQAIDTASADTPESGEEDSAKVVPIDGGARRAGSQPEAERLGRQDVVP